MDEIDEMIEQNRHKCPHCKLLYELFLEQPELYNGEREDYLMTEAFVYLHGGDECTYLLKGSKCLK